MKLITLLLILSFQVFAQSNPQERDCVDASLSILDRWEYDSRIELMDIISSCQNNLGGECLLESIKSLSSFEYDDRMEVTAINRSCQFITDECLKVSKSFLRKSNYDDRHEITLINQMCQRTDSTCLNYYCSISPKNCDSLMSIIAMVQYCKN